MEFDADGSYLATGDKGGRVVLFEKVSTLPVSTCVGRGDAGVVWAQRQQLQEEEEPTSAAAPVRMPQQVISVYGVLNNNKQTTAAAAVVSSTATH